MTRTGTMGDDRTQPNAERLGRAPGEGALTAATTMERSMLRTRVERGACWFDVCTYVPQASGGRRQATDDDGPPPWTAVWRRPCIALAWLRYYAGPTSPGGLEEAHHAVVARVQAGTLPQEGTR